MSIATKRICAIAVGLAVVAGCGGPSDSAGVHPLKKDGTRSQAFEQGDVDTAAGASQAVKDYCGGAGSDAQRLGCEAHVTDADLP